MTVSVRHYQVCTRCVMDTSAPDIVFDEAGVCGYCTEFISQKSLRTSSTDSGYRDLDYFVAEIKKASRRKAYDCVVGVSGGVDSSWVLVQAVKLGLRPLAVHMDNGWNSELAQHNIHNLITALGIDLITYVVDWTEYRRLMQAFFNADVVDVELLYDNAMLAVNYRQAMTNGLQYILAGTNVATEGMRMPPGWNWFKFDKRNIRAIGETQGVKLSSFPSMGLAGLAYARMLRRVRWISFLDMVHYNKEAAIQALENDFGYKRYPYKHYESVFTRFYQGHILPVKFHIDKRRLHLSTLIADGQMTREEGERLLAGSPYPNAADLKADQAYFLKKMGWTPQDLADYLARPGVPHDRFSSERPLRDLIVRARPGTSR